MNVNLHARACRVSACKMDNYSSSLANFRIIQRKKYEHTAISNFYRSFPLFFRFSRQNCDRPPRKFPSKSCICYLFLFFPPRICIYALDLDVRASLHFIFIVVFLVGIKPSICTVWSISMEKTLSNMTSRTPSENTQNSGTDIAITFPQLRNRLN